MRAISLLAGLVGLAAITALLPHIGLGVVARSLLATGFAGFVAVCAAQLSLAAAMGLTWSVPLLRANRWAAIAARLVWD